MFAITALAFGLGGPTNATAQLSSALARLGTTSYTFKDYEVLDRQRCDALPLIVRELLRLPAVQPGKVGGNQGRPDSWLSNRTSDLLRALRILTNHDVYGPISRKAYAALPRYPEPPGVGYVMQRVDLIRDLERGTSRYYAYRLSHGVSFYAPVATQRAIKAKWKTYIRTFDCRKKLPEGRWDATFFNG
ncbi:hypothetical protein OK349_13165 [Sphingomonas sp. BT-65]|uniref:hypothetical protein n=1 Tax=Sphingomonas sp. BT-65 TaxID=2989821 RepID=UPI00223678DC|nr:hypothetical protein [Sphingomonas sp. BT-65]MCW4462661.1 hypothetical protein [Sphingomonas sp. BT-65]